MSELPAWLWVRCGGCRLRWFILVALLTMVGCQGRGNITGVVNLTGTGKPLKNGKITFVSESSHAVATSGISDGKYEIKNFPAGPTTVGIESVEFPPPSGSGRPPQPTYLTDPKYADPQTSGLTYDVQTGDQTKEFEVPPAPKK